LAGILMLAASASTAVAMTAHSSTNPAQSVAQATAGTTIAAVNDEGDGSGGHDGRSGQHDGHGR
jgi:hypothetical protein